MPKAAEGPEAVSFLLSLTGITNQPSLVWANECIVVTGSDIVSSECGDIQRTHTPLHIFEAPAAAAGGGTVDSEEWYPGCYHPTLDWAKKGPVMAARSCR